MNEGAKVDENLIPVQVLDLIGDESGLSSHVDILDLANDLSYDQAYRTQFLAKRLQSGANGVVIGYQASLTTAAAQQRSHTRRPDMPLPYFGTLQLRNWHDPLTPFQTYPGTRIVECEVGVRLRKPLAGDSVTADEARDAVWSIHPALEIVHRIPALAERSGQHMVAIHNFGSSVVFGPACADVPGDILDEPVTLRFDGQTVTSATVGDSGGGPFQVLADLASHLGRFDMGLEAGMVVMTGSTTLSQELPADILRVVASFGRLGEVSAKFPG